MLSSAKLDQASQPSEGKSPSQAKSSPTPASSSEARTQADANDMPSSEPVEPALRRVAELIKSGKAKNVVVMTGAGISTSAGIPDFRSPETGLYANLERLNLPFPEAVFELGYFRRSPQAFWTLAKDLYPGKYLPTPAHYFLSLLHKHSVLLRVFSQNIDTLETVAGLPPSQIIEAHGSFATSHCLTCRAETSREYVLENGVREGKIVKCGNKVKGKTGQSSSCGGLVKPDIVFFGENLPDRFFDSLGDLKKCDLLIVIGTSLQVHPFASLTGYVPTSTPRLLINLEAVGPFSRLQNARSSASGPNPSGPEGGLNKMLSQIYGADEEDETPSRDTWWGGQADEGCRSLAKELGWADELEEAIREGRRKLQKEWGLDVGGEAVPPDAKAEAAELAKEIKRAESTGQAVEQTKPVSPPPATEKGEKDDSLDQLLSKQLNLEDEK